MRPVVVEAHGGPGQRGADRDRQRHRCTPAGREPAADEADLAVGFGELGRPLTVPAVVDRPVDQVGDRTADAVVEAGETVEAAVGAVAEHGQHLGRGRADHRFERLRDPGREGAVDEAVPGRTASEEVHTVDGPRELDVELGGEGRHDVGGLHRFVVHHAVDLARQLVEERYPGDGADVGVVHEAGGLAGEERDAVVGDHDHCGLVEDAGPLEPVEVLTEQSVGEADLQQVSLLRGAGRRRVVVPLREVARELEVGVGLAAGVESPRYVRQQRVEVVEAGDVGRGERGDLGPEVGHPRVVGQQLVEDLVVVREDGLRVDLGGVRRGRIHRAPPDRERGDRRARRGGRDGIRRAGRGRSVRLRLGASAEVAAEVAPGGPDGRQAEIQPLRGDQVAEDHQRVVEERAQRRRIGLR